MSEFIATVTIQRSARGEGDVPVVVVAGSGSGHTFNHKSDNETCEKALDDALTVVRAGLAAIGVAI